MEATMDIRKGDVVQLKSGGPKMTVAHIDEHESAYCQWFVGGKQEGQSFPVSSLVKL